MWHSVSQMTRRKGVTSMMTIPETASRVRLMRAWIAQNPLRLWRESQSISLRMAAAMFDVNLYTVQAWESGTTIPSQENLREVLAVVNDDTLAPRWTTWLSDKPEMRVLRKKE